MSKKVTFGNTQGKSEDAFIVLDQNEANDLLALGYRVNVLDPGEGGLSQWNSARGTGNLEDNMNMFGGLSHAILLLPKIYLVDGKVQKFIEQFKTQLEALEVELVVPELPVGTVRQFIEDNKGDTESELFMVLTGEFEDPSIDKNALSEETGSDFGDKYKALLESDNDMSATTALRMMQDHFTTAFDPENNVAVATPKNGTSMLKISYDIEGTEMTHWLRDEYEQYTDKVIAKNNVTSAINTLSSKAVRSGEKTKTAKRAYRNNGEVWIDLGNDTSECIRVNKEGWVVYPNIPSEVGVSFIRDERVTPIKTPANVPLDKAMDTLTTYLRPYVNTSGEDWVLLVAWLVNHILENESPILMFLGEPGLGKSTACQALQFSGEGGYALQDLPKMPEKVSDLIVNLSSTRIGTFDNVSKISNDMSDTWCQTTTGLEYKVRKLHTNNEVSKTKVTARIVANAISTNELRDDVKERLVTIRLTKDIENQMKKEHLKNFLVENHPLVYGSALALAVKVLEVQENAPIFESKGANGMRMQEYARVLWSLDQILGTDGIEQYKETLNISAQEGYDDPLIQAVMMTMIKNGSYVPEEDRWVGRLYNSDILNEYANENFRDRLEGVKKKPLTARTLPNVFTRNSSGWRRLGIQIGSSARAVNSVTGKKETYYDVVISGEDIVDELRELQFRHQEQPLGA